MKKVFALVFISVSVLCGFEKSSKIFVAGHNGLVGSALIRKLNDMGYHNLVVRSRSELDLTDKSAVEEFFKTEQPEYVFLAAAKVGGIKANEDYAADFIYENLMIESNIIHAAHAYVVKKLLFLGSSCIYPKRCAQPIREEYLLSGLLEPTNDAYAVAKIAGIKMCQSYNKQYGTNFICCMPTNLYGPNDNYDLNNSHVMPALIRKFTDAKESGAPQVTIWGSGTPKREFLYVDDLAEACIFLMKNYDGSEIVNIGTGKDIAIKDLALLIKGIVGYEGELVFDSSKPDGTLRKVLDTSKIEGLGWQPGISLEMGIKKAVESYNKKEIRKS